jgi:hypothetical protein
MFTSTEEDAMKRLLVVALLLIATKTAEAQPSHAVSWNAASETGLSLPRGHRCGNISDPPYPVVILSDGSCNYDTAREPIDVAVIHHTESHIGFPLDSLSIWGWERLYGPNNRRSSGHYYTINGEPQEVYWGYHWLIRADGTIVRLLPDSAIGWHAGNRWINRRAVGIALEGSYTNSTPPPQMLRALESILAMYPGVREILPHWRAKGLNSAGRRRTQCPGAWFEPWLNEYLNPRPLPVRLPVIPSTLPIPTSPILKLRF